MPKFSRFMKSGAFPEHKAAMQAFLQSSNKEDLEERVSAWCAGTDMKIGLSRNGGLRIQADCPGLPLSPTQRTMRDLFVLFMYDTGQYGLYVNLLREKAKHSRFSVRLSRWAWGDGHFVSG